MINNKFHPINILLLSRFAVLGLTLLLSACALLPVGNSSPASEVIIPDASVPFAWLNGGTQLVLFAGADRPNDLRFGVYSINVDGDTNSLAPFTELAENYDPISLASVSPNGQQIILKGSLPDTHYYLINQDGQTNVPILELGQRGYIGWSTDSRYLRIVENGKYSVLDTQNDFALEFELPLDFIPSDISADGSRMVYVEADGSLVVFDVASQTKISFPASTTKLSSEKVVVRFSPNGQYIVYSETIEDAPFLMGEHLIILDIANNEIYALTTDDFFYALPGWSPRGDYIAATRFSTQYRTNFEEHRDALEVVLIRVPEKFQE